jgi:hypothetical protein
MSESAWTPSSHSLLPFFSSLLFSSPFSLSLLFFLDSILCVAGVLAGVLEIRRVRLAKSMEDSTFSTAYFSISPFPGRAYMRSESESNILELMVCICAVTKSPLASCRDRCGFVTNY